MIAGTKLTQVKSISLLNVYLAALVRGSIPIVAIASPIRPASKDLSTDLVPIEAIAVIWLQNHSFNADRLLEKSKSVVSSKTPMLGL